MHDWIGAENVIDKERVRELSERSNGPATLYLLSHVGAIALTTTGLLLHRRHVVVCAVLPASGCFD